MKEQVLENVRKEGILKKTLEVGEKVAQAGVEATRLRARAALAVDDGVDAARRAVRRGRYAAEDLMDETAYRIKKDPLNSVAITLGAGVGFGLLVGWFIGRNSRR